ADEILTRASLVDEVVDGALGREDRIPRVPRADAQEQDVFRLAQHLEPGGAAARSLDVDIDQAKIPKLWVRSRHRENPAATAFDARLVAFTEGAEHRGARDVHVERAPEHVAPPEQEASVGPEVAAHVGQARRRDLLGARRAALEVTPVREARRGLAGEHRVRILDLDLDGALRDVSLWIARAQRDQVSPRLLEHVRGDRAFRTVLRGARRAVGAALGVTEIPAVRKLVEGTLDALRARLARIEVYRERGDAADAARLESKLDLRTGPRGALGEAGLRLFRSSGLCFPRE